ncbi:MAG: hypothetical protein M3Z24_01420, partial [Chloroflexota bacterium]|nr:hypothetical protein [Chloroflexota bacterium]
MDDVVPSVLQRLRAADIIRMAGLAGASQGQEYCRLGAVSATMRRGNKLLGIVDTSRLPVDMEASSTNGAGGAEQIYPAQRQYPVDVEIHDAHFWLSSCSCNPNPNFLCSHSAALLYFWLNTPEHFSTSVPPSLPTSSKRTQTPQLSSSSLPAKGTRPWGQSRPAEPDGEPASRPNMIEEILAQSGLGDVRSIAREYGFTTAGINKQELTETLLATFKQPEAVRRV